jgi:hypothetical protein
MNASSKGSLARAMALMMVGSLAAAAPSGATGSASPPRPGAHAAAPGVRPPHPAHRRGARAHPATCSGVGQYSFVGGSGGPSNNVAFGYGSGVLSGDANSACADWSGVAVGEYNETDALHTFIGGGEQNVASVSSYDSGILAGFGNSANAYESGVVAGDYNNVQGFLGFIGAGYGNSITTTNSSCATNVGIVTGKNNTIFCSASNTANSSIIGAGDSNTLTGQDGAIVAGGSNTESGDYGSVVGGYKNGVNGSYGFVGGGYQNVAGAGYSGIVSGLGNSTGGSRGENGVVAGSSNNNQGAFSLIGAGTNNTAKSLCASTCSGGAATAIVAGSSNTIDGSIANTANNSIIGAGSVNTLTGQSAAIVSGGSNAERADFGFIGSGAVNGVKGAYGAVVGGYKNSANGSYAFIGGGSTNAASGQYAAIPGGLNNAAKGIGSFAGGSGANALHNGAFVWSDQNVAPAVKSTAANQFVARAAGGVTFYSSVNLSTGVKLAAGSGSWSSVSDRAVKTAIVPLDDAAILAKVASLPVSEWSYAAQGTGVRHMGPMAQDFRAAFGVGEDDRHIATIDEGGVALAAIKGLAARASRENASLRSQVAQEGAEIASLRSEVAQLAAEVQQRKRTH